MPTTARACCGRRGWASASSWRAGERLAVLAEARAENMENPRALRALPARASVGGTRFDVQAGLIPPVFGRFARAGYGADNPLIGTLSPTST